MHGDRHVLEAGPGVIARIVVIVVGKHAGRPFSAPYVEAAASHHAVHSAASPQHGGCGRPGPGPGVEDFVRRRHLRRQAVAEAPADDVDAAIDGGAGQVIALARQVREDFPAVRRRIVGREVVAARRAPAGHVDLAVEHDGDARAARGRHRRLSDPLPHRRIQLIDRVLVPLVRHIRGLAADQIDLAVDAGRHPVVVGLRKLWAERPLVGRDVVDLHRA